MRRGKSRREKCQKKDRDIRSQCSLALTELSVPSTGKFPDDIPFCIVDISFEFARSSSSPTSRLECQYTFLASSMIGDFHVSIMIDLRVTHYEIRYTRGDLLPTVMLSHVAGTQCWLIVVGTPFFRQHKICMCYSGWPNFERLAQEFRFCVHFATRVET